MLPDNRVVEAFIAMIERGMDKRNCIAYLASVDLLPGMHLYFDMMNWFLRMKSIICSPESPALLPSVDRITTNNMCSQLNPLQGRRSYTSVCKWDAQRTTHSNSLGCLNWELDRPLFNIPSNGLGDQFYRSTQNLSLTLQFPSLLMVITRSLWSRYLRAMERSLWSNFYQTADRKWREMFRLFFGCSKETFKPVKRHPSNSKRQDFSNCTSTLLGRGNIHEAVILPMGEDLNEWLAANSKITFSRNYLEEAVSSMYQVCWSLMESHFARS